MEAVAVRQRGVRSVTAKALPVTCCALLAGAAVVVARNDPSAPGSHFPACVFHSATGLWCPGCGLTRGMHALLNGHVGEALSSNLFTPFAVVATVLLMTSWLRTAWGRPRVHLGARLERRLTIVGPAVVLAYGVLRNVPVAPLRSLAP